MLNEDQRLPSGSCSAFYRSDALPSLAPGSSPSAQHLKLKRRLKTHPITIPWGVQTGTQTPGHSRMGSDAVRLESSPRICILNNLLHMLPFENLASIHFSPQAVHHALSPSDTDETCTKELIPAGAGIKSTSGEMQLCACASGRRHPGHCAS